MAGRVDGVDLELVVAHVDEPASGVRRVELAAPDGGELPAWQPGAHVDLCLTPDLVRQYSLCGEPGRRDRWTVAVLREPDGRGGSAFVHDKLAVGDRLTVRGPRNNFELAPAPGYVFIAGGIGITVFRSMLRYIADTGEPYRITLVYSNRDRESTPFLDELPELESRIPGLRLVLTMTQDEGWEGETRYIGPDLLRDHLEGDLGSYTYLIAGPPEMVEAVTGGLAGEGVPEEQLLPDRFSGY